MKAALLVATASALSACATEARPPSLLPRAIETQPETVATPPDVPAKPLEPALAATLASLVAEAMAGDTAFTKVVVASGATIAGGSKATPGSERWLAAEQARSALIAAHQRSTSALAEIDALTIARVNMVANDASVGGLAEYQAAQAQVEALVSRQSQQIEALSR